MDSLHYATPQSIEPGDERPVRVAFGWMHVAHGKIDGTWGLIFPKVRFDATKNTAKSCHICHTKSNFLGGRCNSWRNDGICWSYMVS